MGERVRMISYVTLQIRVRYAETDQMQVAYYGRYFEWFEAGRAEFCRQKNAPYAELEALGLFLPVAQASCRYKAPAHYDEEIDVLTGIVRITQRTVEFEYRVVRGDELLAEGATTHILVNTKGRPSKFPPDFLSRLTAEPPDR
jgi:acyl-CoA thioester hydrolase